MEEGILDERIRDMQEKLRILSEDEDNQKWLFVTEDDIKNLPCFLNETLIAIKAPHGTTLEVPDPDEGVDYQQRRYRIILRSTMGPIDVYLVSQFEEKFDEMNDSEQSLSYPMVASSGPNENHAAEKPPVDDRITEELGPSQDHAVGMMKIVPSDVDNNEDYWLLSDAGVSITDLWKSDGGGLESYFCFVCQCHQIAKLRCKLNASMTDTSNTVMVTMFDSIAEEILKKTSAEMHDMTEQETHELLRRTNTRLADMTITAQVRAQRKRFDDRKTRYSIQQLHFDSPNEPRQQTPHAITTETVQKETTETEDNHAAEKTHSQDRTHLDTGKDGDADSLAPVTPIKKMKFTDI